MQLFDTHFHYSGEASPAEYRNRILADASGAGVFPETLELNAVGGDFLESLRARSFAYAVPDCIFSVGIHPGSVERFSGNISDFETFRDDPLLAAVGELGLDYFYAAETAPRQREVFAGFLQLALEWKKPAIVHLRDQGDDAAFKDGMVLRSTVLPEIGSGEKKFWNWEAISALPEWSHSNVPKISVISQEGFRQSGCSLKPIRLILHLSPTGAGRIIPVFSDLLLLRSRKCAG